MKKIGFLTSFLILTLGMSIFTSCNKDEKDTTGFITFGANYDIVDCLSTVTIYIDGENIGTLNNPTNSINECGEESNITKELPIGEHSYTIEIRSETGTNCTKDINGIFVISENQCEKIFTDYEKVFSDQSDCDQDVIISETEYEKAPSDPFTITEIQIDGDCLNIKFNASGCDGNSWTVKLIDSGRIAESYPSQRFLRLSLDNKEVCTAVISKEVSINIKDLQIIGNDKVTLHVSGKGILYEY